MSVIRVLAVIALAGATLLPAGAAWAQTQNTRIQPQASSINNDGMRKVTGQQKTTVEEAQRAAAAKKKAENRGIGAPLKPLQRP